MRIHNWTIIDDDVTKVHSIVSKLEKDLNGASFHEIKARICTKCYKKEYIICIGKNKKRVLERSATKSDIRDIKLDKLITKLR